MLSAYPFRNRIKIIQATVFKIDTTLCAKKRNIFNYYHYFLASIKTKHGNFCPEKCQTNFNCRTDNLVCPTCQDGWGRPYCHRKFLIAVSNNLAAYFF